MLLKPFNCAKPTNFKHKLETGVKNGDCLPACFAAMLECLHRGCITSGSLETPASKLRADLIKWIKSQWNTYPVFNPEMKVHEIMWMQHDMGITAKERDANGEWGDTADSRLAKYTEQCDRLYFSDSEMFLFACWMFEEKGLPLYFRTWRCTGTGGGSGEFVAGVPDPKMLQTNGITEAVVIDMDHNGRVDGLTAHYKLLDGGSLDGLTEVKTARWKRHAAEQCHPDPDAKRSKAAQSADRAASVT